MLSLANAFSNEELAEWEERNARLALEVRTAGYTPRSRSTVPR
jgi:NAD-dependent DNA ligase